MRHELAVAHVPCQRRTVTVEEYDDHARFANIEALRNMHEDAVVVVSLVLPVNPATVAAVPLASAFGDVQERLVGMGIAA